MSLLLQHYALPCEQLPELPIIGVARIAIFAFRCGACDEDFHIDDKPQYCPFCGAKFTEERAFGK